MSTGPIYEAVIAAVSARTPAASGDLQHLDIGAGRGELIAALRQVLPVQSYACDYHVERFQVEDVRCVQCDFDNEPLPFENARFDVVTSSEVIEHLENYRRLLRESFRVLRDGGLLVVTTPNVLNAASRVRYVISGFANLFGPLPVRNDKLYSTGGHLTPINFFYLAHALLDAGFTDIRLDIDKVQRTSVFCLALTFPVIFIGKLRFMSRERRKFRTITPENEPLVLRHFSWPILVGRTIVVSASKVAAPTDRTSPIG